MPGSLSTHRFETKWGMPVARFSGNVHPHTFEIGVVQATARRGLAQRGGSHRHAGQCWQAHYRFGWTHQAGTCRMGNDLIALSWIATAGFTMWTTSLFIDGSVHVTNGGFQSGLLPSWPIAYFASESLVRNWKGTGFRS